MDIKTFVTSAITFNVWVTASYIICTTLAVIVLTQSRVKKRTRYMVVKKEVPNLGIWKRESVLNDDAFLEELFSENLRLTEENKILKKENTRLTIGSFCILLVVIIYIYIREHTPFKQKSISS